MSKEYYKMSINELINLMKKGELTALELCNYFVNRINKIGLVDSLNAVKCINPLYIEEAKKIDSDGLYDLPLSGIPYLVKDNIDLKGLPTTAGCNALADNIALEDAKVIENLRKNGAICIGKVNMTELANYLSDDLPDGYSSYGGQVLNAYDKTYSPSSSSSGSGTAASCGLAKFTLGSDTSFSIVGCACVHGVIGYRPKKDNICISGVVPISKYMDTVGVFTKHVEDLVVILNGLLESEVKLIDKDNYKLGISLKGIDKLSEKDKQIYNELYEKLRSKNVTISEVNVPTQSIIYKIMKKDYAYSMDEYLSNANSKMKTMEDIVNYFYQNSEVMMKYGANVIIDALALQKTETNREELDKLLEEQKEFKRDLESAIKEYDAVVMTGFDTGMHVAGLPSLSIPFKFSDGDVVPNSIIIYSSSEDKLISIAKKIEECVDDIPYPSISNIID